MTRVGRVLTPSVARERAWAKRRRVTNKEAGACINENKAGTHGVATHGCRCERCHAKHRSKKS